MTGVQTCALPISNQNGVRISTVFAMHLETSELDTLFTVNDVADVHPDGAKIRDNKYAVLKSPKWSPDAKYMLIKLKAKDRTGDATIAKHVLVANADGKNIKLIFDKKANHPMWYDTNSIYAYISFKRKNRSNAGNLQYPRPKNRYHLSEEAHAGRPTPGHCECE